MSLTAKDNGSGDYKLVPEGTHIARAYLLVDIGLQETNFGIKPKIVLGWEIPEEKLDDGRPMSITSIYTNSLNEKANLRRDLESWRSKRFTETELAGFDLRNVLGKPCQITVVHNDSQGKTYANVTAVTAIPKGLPVPDAINELVVYEMGDPIPDTLPEWMVKKIEAARDEDSDFSDLEKLEDLEDEALPF